MLLKDYTLAWRPISDILFGFPDAQCVASLPRLRSFGSLLEREFFESVQVTDYLNICYVKSVSVVEPPT